MIYSLLALLSGGTVATSILLNARLAAVKGLNKGVFINYIMGLVVSLPIALLINGTAFPAVEFNWSLAVALTGGAIGFLAVMMNSYLTPRIGILYITILLFIGQIGTGVVIDGIREGVFQAGKIIGGILIVAGLVYLLRLERNKKASQ